MTDFFVFVLDTKPLYNNATRIAFCGKKCNLYGAGVKLNTFSERKNFIKTSHIDTHNICFG